MSSIASHGRLVPVLFFAALLMQRGHAQTCSTGKIDERAAALLKTHPGHTVNEMKSISLEKLKNDRNGIFRKLPGDSVQRIRITDDNIGVNVVNASGGKGLPVIINFHPGGFIRPLLPSMEYEAMRLAKKFGAVVFDIDYRVAPEHKFPAAVHDAYNAFRWVSQNAGTYGGDTGKIILAGSGAGANLAALTAHRARKEGTLGPVRLVIMTCPPTDNPMISYYSSYEDNARGYFFTKDQSIFNFQTYLDKTEWYKNNPEMWPIYEKDVSGLPPFLIITTEFDVLRDEGIAYGRKLEQAGNAVSIKCFPHQLHRFEGLPEDAAELSRVYELMGESIAASLGGAGNVR